MPKRSLPLGEGGNPKRRRLQGGLSLEQFATAKASGFDIKHERDKQRALNAKQVNKYRRLRQKLQQTGRLNPKVPVERLAQEEDLDCVGGASQADGASREDRALARAGPAPDTDSEDEFGDADEQAPAPQAPQSRRPQSSQATAWRQQQRKASGKEKGRRDSSEKQKPKPQLQRLAEEVQAKKEAEKQQQQAERLAAEERKARLAAATKARKQQTAQLRKKTKRGQPIMKHRIINLLSALQE